MSKLTRRDRAILIALAPLAVALDLLRWAWEHRWFALAATATLAAYLVVTG